MSRDTLTGTRIREQRMRRGIKQSELALTVGISPSYLNLIEHNRRRIGGKLLVDLARVLSVETAILSEGAESALLETLGVAASAVSDDAPELRRIEEFVGRFPGWAGLLASQHHRIEDLERTVATLTDRLTHDPQLAASLHEVLSTVTAIRSTSSILAENDDIDAEWQARFHKNLFSDAIRLAESSQALVSYLDGENDAEANLTSPQEEVEAYLKRENYHLKELERALTPTVEDLVEASSDLATAPARKLATRYLTRYRADAKRMPLKQFAAAARASAYDPGALAQEFGTDMASVLRRIATLPTEEGELSFGLVICDGSGALVFRKPLEDFPMPRFGAACPLWPLYQALTRPMSPVRRVVEQAGRVPRRFLTYAISQPAHPVGFDGPQVFEATMLIIPQDFVDLPAGGIVTVGTSCRICPQEECVARREPSILMDGF